MEENREIMKGNFSSKCIVVYGDFFLILCDSVWCRKGFFSKCLGKYVLKDLYNISVIKCFFLWFFVLELNVFRVFRIILFRNIRGI